MSVLSPSLAAEEPLPTEAPHSVTSPPQPGGGSLQQLRGQSCVAVAVPGWRRGPTPELAPSSPPFELRRSKQTVNQPSSSESKPLPKLVLSWELPPQSHSLDRSSQSSPPFALEGNESVCRARIHWACPLESPPAGIGHIPASCPLPRPDQVGMVLATARDSSASATTATFLTV